MKYLITINYNKESKEIKTDDYAIAYLVLRAMTDTYPEDAYVDLLDNNTGVVLASNHI